MLPSIFHEVTQLLLANEIVSVGINMVESKAGSPDYCGATMLLYSHGQFLKHSLRGVILNVIKGFNWLSLLDTN
jgi:hypothetical protein